MLKIFTYFLLIAILWSLIVSGIVENSTNNTPSILLNTQYHNMKPGDHDTILNYAQRIIKFTGKQHYFNIGKSLIHGRIISPRIPIKDIINILRKNMFTGFYNSQPIITDQFVTIYIRSDGSIETDPPGVTVPISREDDVYILTGDIYGRIVIEKDNIEINGQNYRLYGNGDETGIKVYGKSNIIIKYLNISSFDDGVGIYYSNYVTIVNNIIIGNNYNGLYLVNVKDVIVEFNTIRNNWYGAFFDNAENVVVGNNIVQNNDYGIGFSSSLDVSIVNNEILGNSVGLEIWDSSDIFVEYNSIANSYSGGLTIFYSNVTIANNIIVKNKYNGISVESSNVTIRGNTISESEDGVYLLDSMGVITYNYVNKNTEHGIYLYSENTILSNNVIENNGEAGIYIDGSNNITVGNNLIKFNDYGIYMYRSEHTTIKSNTIEDNTYGIYFTTLENNIVINNVLMSNENGITLDGTSDVVVVNNLVENNGYGIYIWYSVNNIVVGNRVVGNTYGIYIDTSSDCTIYLNNFIDNMYNYGSNNPRANRWHFPAPITYVYNGKVLTGFLGNYWSDYTGVDNNNDGVGDTPHILDGENVDQYPLIVGINNYYVVPLLSWDAIDIDWHCPGWISPAGDVCQIPEVDYTAWLCCNTTSEPRMCQLILRDAEGDVDEVDLHYVRLFLNNRGLYFFLKGYLLIIPPTPPEQPARVYIAEDIEEFSITLWLNTTNKRLNLIIKPVSKEVFYELYDGSDNLLSSGSIYSNVIAHRIIGNITLVESFINLSEVSDFIIQFGEYNVSITMILIDDEIRADSVEVLVDNSLRDVVVFEVYDYFIASGRVDTQPIPIPESGVLVIVIVSLVLVSILLYKVRRELITLY